MYRDQRYICIYIYTIVIYFISVSIHTHRYVKYYQIEYIDDIYIILILIIVLLIILIVIIIKRSARPFERIILWWLPDSFLYVTFGAMPRSTALQARLGTRCRL